MTREHFVQGILVVDDPAYIGEPDLLLANGETLHLLYSDLRTREERVEENSVSLLLEENHWYEMLLIVQIGLGERKVIYQPANQPHKDLKLQTTEVQIYEKTRVRNDIVQGVILDLSWKPESVSYQAIAGPRIYAQRFVLIETAVGKMVLDYQALEKQALAQVNLFEPGGYLEWERARLDILAILARRDPESHEASGV